MGTDSPEKPVAKAEHLECENHPTVGSELDGIDSKTAQRRLVRVARAFRMLAACTQAMLTGSDELWLLQRLCCIIVKTGGYGLAWVGYAQFDEAKTVKPVAQAGEGQDYVRDIKVSWADNEYGRGPTGLAIRTGEPYVTRDIAIDPDFEPWRDTAGEFGYTSSIAIPLYCESAVLGALNVYSGEPDAFDAEEVALLEELAGDMSFGIASIRNRLERQVTEEELRLSWAKLRRTLQGTVRAMAAVTELRDPYTAGHQQRVSELAGAIAGEMGFSEDEVEGVRIAGVVHDIGKVYVPIQILAKPGSLSTVEYNLVKVHSEAGYDILKNVEFPWPIAEIVLQHHERMNGTGYPNGVGGSEILCGSRIIAVADTVEAMSNFRPYRPAHGIVKALEEVLSNSGTLYDPVPAQACARLFKEKGFRLAQN